MDEYVKAAVSVAAGSVPAREKGSMTDWTPNEEQAKRAYVTGMRQAFIASAGEHAEEWDRFIAAHDRVVAANAWDECKKELWSEIRQLPSWTDPATGHSEFDLQPLGPDATSEYGARELIVDIFEETSNPYHITEENN